MTSPTQRSLKLLRGRGYATWVVEHWNHFSRKREDLFGAWDIIGVGEDGVIFVQTTSRTNVSARVKKIAENEYTPDIRKAGVRLEVHGWAKGTNGRWACRIVDVS